MSEKIGLDPLVAIVDALKPLKSEERLRTVEAALHYLGEEPLKAAGSNTSKDASKASAQTQESMHQNLDYPPNVAAWLKQHNVSTDHLDRMFHFAEDGTFAIHDVPGSSAKQKSLNVYLLTGLGTFIATGKRTFSDEVARSHCQTLGCYDRGNLAKHLKNYKGGEFTGDKKKGYSITNPGLKRGATLVKELAEEGKA